METYREKEGKTRGDVRGKRGRMETEEKERWKERIGRRKAWRE